MKSVLPVCHWMVPLLVIVDPSMNLLPPMVPDRTAPLATCHPPAKLPPVQFTVPLSCALVPVNVPLVSERFADVKAPLKLALLLTVVEPAPMNCVPALKLTLPPLKL